MSERRQADQCSHHSCRSWLRTCTPTQHMRFLGLMKFRANNGGKQLYSNKALRMMSYVSSSQNLGRCAVAVLLVSACCEVKNTSGRPLVARRKFSLALNACGLLRSSCTRCANEVQRFCLGQADPLLPPSGLNGTCNTTTILSV